MKRLVVIAFVLAGCAEATPRYTMSVRALGVPSPLGAAHGGVTVAAVAVTRTNWLEHRSIVSRINWKEVDNATQARDPSGAIVGAAPGLRTEDGDVPLTPLPSFEVRFLNHSGAPLSFAGARLELDDGHGRRFAAITDEQELEKRVEAEVIARHRDVGLPANREVLTFLRGAASGVKRVRGDLVIPDGGDWQGFVSFELDARDTADMRAFMLDAHELTLRFAGLFADGAPIEMRFPILRKPKGVTCSDGSRKANIGDCQDEERTEPVDDGPCIQQTKKRRTVAGSQWWMGGTPLADSDLHRTLLAEPVARVPLRKGLILRAIGYSMIGAGLIAVAIAAPTISHVYGESYGPATTGFAAISLVGIVVTIIGQRRSDEAIRLYNEQADATGLCQPLF